MKVYRNLNQLPSFKNSVVTIGSFDGVHNGHQAILNQINTLAQRYNGESVVVTFDPHPRQVIYPKDASLRLLTTTDEKVALFRRYGIDNVVIVPFTVEFSQQSADEYIERFLVEKFNPKCIVVGYDHKFGLNRQGDIYYLRDASQRLGFEVVEIPKQEVTDITISSTKIRNAVEKGQMRQANTLLGHRYILTGKVVRGQRIGTSIGFPTANIFVENPHKLVPPQGIYACEVLVKETRYGGMLYIGNRPTIHGEKNESIEVNIFDFNAEIYNSTIQIEYIAYIRSDEKYDNLEQLQAALRTDKIATLSILKKENRVKKKHSNLHS